MASAHTSLTFDTRDLTRAMRAIQDATGKEGAVILNQAGRNIAFRAIRHTYKTTVARITADLGTPAKPSALAYRIAARAMGRRPTKDEVAKMIKRRRSAIAYLRAGWVQAAKDFGGRPRMRYSGKGEARRGGGRKARNTSLVATLNNTAPAIELYGKPGLERAVRETAADMVAHAERRLQRAYNRFI